MRIPPLAMLALLAQTSFLGAQTGLDQRPTSAAGSSFENMFAQREREAKARAAAANKAALETARTQLDAQWKALGAVTIRGRVLSVLPESKGVLVTCGGNNSGDPVSLFGGKLDKVPRELAPPALGSVVVLLKTPAELGVLVDGDPVHVVAGPTTETFRYTTALGAVATVRVYGMRPPAAKP